MATIKRLKIMAILAERSGSCIPEIEADAAPRTNPVPTPAINSSKAKIMGLGMKIPSTATATRIITPVAATPLRLCRCTRGADEQYRRRVQQRHGGGQRPGEGDFHTVIVDESSDDGRD